MSREQHRWCNGKQACLQCCRSWVQVPLGSNQRLKLVFAASPLRRKSRDWLDQNNVSGWCNMSCRLLWVMQRVHLQTCLGDTTCPPADLSGRYMSTCRLVWVIQHVYLQTCLEDTACLPADLFGWYNVSTCRLVWAIQRVYLQTWLGELALYKSNCVLV